MLRLPSPCLVVLVGASAAGKSTWAARSFHPDQVLSTDRFRALVGLGEDDQAASGDAFAVLEQVLAHRLRRRLMTVVDSTGLDERSRRRWVEAAQRAGVTPVAICFDLPGAELRRRNRARLRQVPDGVLTTQIKAVPGVVEGLAAEGFTVVSAPGDVRLVPVELWRAQRDRSAPHGGGSGPGAVELPLGTTLRFGLQVQRFGGPGGPAAFRDRLATVAVAAEAAGFSSLWVMDHLRQIPQVGPAWDDMPESWTTLGFLAGVTHTIRLGTLVTPVTFRNVAHLGKIAATLDVVSGGRAWCGLGAGWFAAEHDAYGIEFPPPARRLDILEDALQLLPLIWGPGNAPFRGKVLHVPDTTCYPRPLQGRIPILVGGSGVRRTLRLVARHADAANVFGDAASVRRARAVLARHCTEVGRPLEQVELTHLATALVGEDDAHVTRLVDARRPTKVSAERFAASVHAGTVDEHIARFRTLAAVGVDTAIVSLADLDGPDPVTRLAPVIEALTNEPAGEHPAAPS